MIPEVSPWRPCTTLCILSPFLCCHSCAKSCPTLCNSMDCSMPRFPVFYYLPEFTHFLTCSFLCVLFFLLTFFLIFSTSSQTRFVRMYSNSMFPSNVSSWLWFQRFKKKNHAWHSKTSENVFCKVLTAHFSLISWAEIHILCRTGLFH